MIRTHTMKRTKWAEQMMYSMITIENHSYEFRSFLYRMIKRIVFAMWHPSSPKPIHNIRYKFQNIQLLHSIHCHFHNAIRTFSFFFNHFPQIKTKTFSINTFDDHLDQPLDKRNKKKMKRKTFKCEKNKNEDS